MTQDVREGGIQMTLDVDLGELRGFRGLSHKILRNSSAALYDLFGLAFEEDFADKVCVHVHSFMRVWEMPWRVEGLCEGEVLLCDYTPRDSL